MGGEREGGWREEERETTANGQGLLFLGGDKMLEIRGGFGGGGDGRTIQQICETI